MSSASNAVNCADDNANSCAALKLMWLGDSAASWARDSAVTWRVDRLASWAPLNCVICVVVIACVCVDESAAMSVRVRLSIVACDIAAICAEL